MNKNETLTSIIQNSQKSIEFALSKPKFKKELTDLPKINEIFSFFFCALDLCRVQNLSQVPELPIDLKTLTAGIFKKDQYLISANNVAPNTFKYDAFYIGSSVNNTCIQSELTGIHLSILKQCSDGYHYEPISFSYLLRDEFFDSNSTRFIVPFLNLQTTIPDELTFQWVYLAIRHLSHHLSPLVEYKYLADDPKEIELLKKWNLY